MTEKEMDRVWDELHLARKKRRRDVRTGSIIGGLFAVAACTLVVYVLKDYTWPDAFMIGVLCGALYLLGVYQGFQAADDEHVIRTREE